MDGQLFDNAGGARLAATRRAGVALRKASGVVSIKAQAREALGERSQFQFDMSDPAPRIRRDLRQIF
ncbi:MAG TPA: hypothetical protein PLV07_07095 [Acidiphilium sp.]|uniref:hypothetical protein n=1 Tax=unclassified Acidiphilium TaxID=2617493 RepID=UPI000BD14C3C|nr:MULTISPECIES: hypothetical protein [unclassified Acidiphilium]OYV54438.1 MAG: hypothetical protein B7Z76_14535 [Acidiphilium sp. 20-67-58]HQT62408.1 hypothetical protein [Acidiphilium sp.]HQU11334.1 hypothetical protein [Acidiphilium sp.]